MDDICTYQIEVRSQLDIEEINAMAPVRIELKRTETAATLFIVRTDQSGLMGLLRRLHDRGIQLLSVTYQQGDSHVTK